MREDAAQILETRYKLMTYPRALELQKLLPTLIDVILDNPGAVDALANQINKFGETE
jgi:hypothetical protein